MNDEPREHWMLGNGSFGINQYADIDDLLNDAAEWLACARALTDVLKESLAREVRSDQRRAIFALEAIATLTMMGAECAAHAHARASGLK